MTKITSAIASALIASVSFAGAAMAENNYYDGLTPSSAGRQVPANHENQHSARYGYTGSISGVTNSGNDGSVVLNRGDYYEGAVRPN